MIYNLGPPTKDKSRDISGTLGPAKTQRPNVCAHVPGVYTLRVVAELACFFHPVFAPCVCVCVCVCV
jgi:hypothetical protein